MKVLCIKEGEWIPDDGFKLHQGPSYGEICDVVRMEGADYFVLKQYEVDVDGTPQVFWKEHFIPLSDIDERDLIREEQEGSLETVVK